MDLYLMQHGEATTETEDPARPLTEAGREAVQRVADRAKAAGAHLDICVHSGKLRAEQTALILAGAVGTLAGIQARDGLAPNDPPGPQPSGRASSERPGPSPLSGICRSSRVWPPSCSWGMRPWRSSSFVWGVLSSSCLPFARPASRSPGLFLRSWHRAGVCARLPSAATG